MPVSRRLLASLVLGAAFLLPIGAFAASAATSKFLGAANTANESSTGNTILSVSDVPTTIGNAINLILSISGIALVVYVIYAGILYLRAGLNPENAKKAKQIIVYSVVGLVLIVAAYAISTFVITLLKNSFSPPTAASPTTSSSATGVGSSSSGSGFTCLNGFVVGGLNNDTCVAPTCGPNEDLQIGDDGSVSCVATSSSTNTGSSGGNQQIGP